MGEGADFSADEAAFSGGGLGGISWGGEAGELLEGECSPVGGGGGSGGGLTGAEAAAEGGDEVACDHEVGSGGVAIRQADELGTGSGKCAGGESAADGGVLLIELDGELLAGAGAGSFMPEKGSLGGGGGSIGGCGGDEAEIWQGGLAGGF